MPTLSIDDFMASRKAPALVPDSGKRAITLNADGTASSDKPAMKQAVMSVDDFMKQKSAGGHAPDWTDDVAASAKFFGNEVVGVGQALNPYNIAKGVVNTVLHPIDTGKALINTPGRMYEQFQNNDMAGLAQGIGNVAGSVIAGKVMPEVPGMAQKAAQGLGNAVDASAPYVSALAPVALKGIVSAAKELPVVGSVIKSGGKLLNTVQDVKAAIDDVNAAKAPATKPVTSNSSVTPKQVSVNAASNALGTKPGVTLAESAGKGARTVDSLDPETTQALVDAHKAGELGKLPAQTKVELTQAVKAGDSSTVAKILDGHTATKGVFEAVDNKVNVLAKYVRDHNIDLSQMTPADRQTLADAAIAHGAKHGLPIPKSGKYRGISDDTWKMVLDRTNGN